MSLQLIDFKCKRKPAKRCVNILTEDHDEIILGRHPDNAVCLLSVAISRRHASIKRTDTGYQLTDLKAVNRVYLNDVPVESGASKLLKSGDEIRLGIKNDLAEAEYFTYRFTDGVQIGNNNKRKTSTSPDHCAKQPRCTTTTPSPNLAEDNPAAPQGSDTAATVATVAETEELRRKAEEAAADAIKAKQEAEQRAAAEAKAEAERAALAEQLAELRRLQDEQKAAMAAKEEALRLEMAELQSKHETEVAEALREKEQEMKDSIKSIQTEQNRKEEEMKSKLEERDKQLNAAKEHEKKMEALEAELETTRQEHQRLSEVSAKCAVQEKISDLLEDQLQCTICSELMIKPKNFSCSHTFCGYCIEKWLEKKKECPVCRQRVTVATPNYLICSLIEKAVEEMSEESKEYRKSVVAAREVEIEEAKNKTGKGKKNKNNRQAANNNRNNPSSTSTARPSTTQPASTTTNTPATSSVSLTNTTTASSQLGTTVPEAANEVTIGGAGNNTDDPIVLSSDSEFENSAMNNPDSDNDSSSSSDSDTDRDSDRDSEDDDSDYDEYGYYTGGGGGGWGTYGRCYSCGERGHWRPECPYR